MPFQPDTRSHHRADFRASIFPGHPLYEAIRYLDTNRELLCRYCGFFLGEAPVDVSVSLHFSDPATGDRVSEMALEIPTWLNACFVEKVLRKSEGDNSIHVIDISSKPATKTGDNYGSNMVRIIAEFWHDQAGRKITEKISIVAKMPPQSSDRDVIEQGGYFHVEISMMSDTLVKMNELLGAKHRISGKGLYMHNENPMFLIIEDLAPLGFCMADRSPGLDLAHSILAIRGIARFHAASVAICEKEPKQKEMYTKSVFHQNTPEAVRNIFIEGTKTLADEIAKWPEMKKYSEKVAKLADHIIQKAIEAVKLSEDEFNVINHGDCYLNNMLFKYDNDGKPTDHIFVDFQICVYTSPAIDLLCFINSSPSLDVIENKQDILLKEYLDTLSVTMKQLNCKTQPPTMKELEATLKRRASYGMILFFVAMPILLCSKATNLNDLLSTEFKNLENEAFKKLLIKRLPLYDEWGLLDV